MTPETRTVDNRCFLLGLDELYRSRIKVHERGELLDCARALCGQLDLAPAGGPVEGFYAEEAELSEYFQRMRALQMHRAPDDPALRSSPAYQRLRALSSAGIYGVPRDEGGLLPRSDDVLGKALEANAPDWTMAGLTQSAYERARDGEEHSLVALAALARDPVVLTALRESVVLYACAVAAAIDLSEPSYEWTVDPELTARAALFVAEFNELFNEDVPQPGPQNAAEYWEAAKDAHIYGRCVRIGYDDSAVPARHYHWAVSDDENGYRAVEFWSDELWTTERFRETLFAEGPGGSVSDWGSDAPEPGPQPE